MRNLLADQRILLAAIDERAEMFALWKLHGMDAGWIESEIRRLIIRLEKLNRRIDDEFGH